MINDNEFARAFERGEIAAREFGHATHVRLALAYLQESSSVEETAGRTPTDVQR